MAKRDGKRNDNAGTVADQVAEFIGRSLGQLMSRKEALAKQMAAVEQEIADLRSRVMRQFGDAAPKRRGRPAGAGKSAGKATGRKRTMSAETRAKMAEAARKRWAAKKGQ